jgi:hypothetical protein
MNISAILQPVFVVALLSMVMAIWMYITRVSAMKKLRIHPQKGKDTSKLKDLLPEEVTRISNNYNHLFEQPTLFYAVAISIAVLGHVDVIHIYSAWAYAILRILHSIVQATVDIVMLRFSIFIGSWIALSIMIIHEAIKLFF